MISHHILSTRAWLGKVQPWSRSLILEQTWTPFKPQKRCMSLFVRDIYKSIGYKAPLSDDENNTITTKLNTLQEAELGSYMAKKNSKNIVAHREKYGMFTCAEQLLDVERIETKLLEKLCKELLKDKNTADEKNKAALKEQKMLENFFNKDIFPKPDLKIFTQISDPIVVGLKVSLKSVSYAAMRDDQLLEWSSLPLYDNINSMSHFHHHNLAKKCRQIVESLPRSNFFVLEEPLPLLPKDPFFKTKVNLIKFRSFLLSELMSGNHGINGTSPPDCVHTIKPSVIDKIFNLKVGTDRLCLSERLPYIVEKKALTENPFYLEISDEDWEMYRRFGGQTEESIGAALLQALCFNYLCRHFEQTSS